MAVVFADLYKPVKDALTKSYGGDSHKLEITTKDVVKFNPTFTRDAAGGISSSLSVEGDYTPCKHAAAKLKYAVNEKGILNTKITIDGMPKAKGLKLEGIADLAIGADLSKDKYECKYELKTEKATLTGSVKQDMSAEVTGVIAIQDLQIGGLATCNVAKLPAISSNQVGGRLNISKATSVIAILENLSALKAGFCTSNNGWTWAGEYACKLSDAANGTIAVGTETTLKDGQTVKARVNSKGIVAAAMVQKLSPELKLTSSIELDSTKGFTSKFGTTLAWEK